MASGTITRTDRAVLDALARAGQAYVRLPQDAPLLRKVLPEHEEPRKRLASMASRGSLERIAHGRYVVLPSGARTARQAADLPVLLAAALEGQWPYYLGFLSAIVEHGLTDETSEAVYVAIGARRLPRLNRLGDRPLRMTAMPTDDDGSWDGVERLRARAKMFWYRAGLERTLIDALDRPHLCGRSELWVRAWERAFRERDVDLVLLMALARARSAAVAARAAFLLRELGRTREARILAARPVTGRVLFDAAGEAHLGAWERDRDTGLVVNVPREAITGWLEYGK